MKKSSIWLASIFFMLALFCFVSCKGETPLDNSGDNISSEDNSIGFKIVLPSKNISREVYYTENDASYYSIVMKKDDKVVTAKTGAPGETVYFTVEEEGEYSIQVSAYNEENTLIAEGFASQKITVDDGYLLVKVTLNPKVKKIDIDIEWNDDIENNSVKKMLISGFKVEGLNDSYNHATVKLISVSVNNGYWDEVIAEGIIADETKKLKTGSAFVELANPYIYDAGDSKYFECYLVVEKSGIEIDRIQSFDKDDFSKIVNAKIPIVLSPIGTKDENLEKRMVNVVVNHGIGKFTFVEDEKVPERFAYTALPEMRWADVVAADTAGTWAKIEKTAKADSEFATYKIIVNNLENDPDGMRYVVAGATIGSTKDTAGDHWNAYADNNNDEGLISVVKDGTVEFNFIGKEPSWNEGNGIAIKITAIDDPMQSEPWLCLLCGPNMDNFKIPTDQDYTITIDAKAANAEKKFNVETKERFVKVDSFTLKSRKIAEDAGAGYVAFCASWLPNNEWWPTTPNKVVYDIEKENHVVVAGDVGTATIDLGGVELWAGEPNTFIDIEMQVLNPQTDNRFWDDDAKVMTSFKVHFDDKWIGKRVNIFYDLDNNEVTLEQGHFVNVVGYEIKNLDDNGKKYYIMSQSPADSGNAQPENRWNVETTLFGTVANKGFTVDCASWKVIDEVQVQVKKDNGNGYIDWASGVNLTTTNLDSMPNGSDCVVVIDATAGTAEFVAK